MNGWFSKLAAGAEGLVKSFDSAGGGSGDSQHGDEDRVDKKLIGVFSDARTTLEKTMNSVGGEKSKGEHEKETNMDPGENGAPWTLTQPSLRSREPELKRLILQITQGEEKDAIDRLKIPPPPESDFEFDFDKDTNKAMHALEADPQLSRVRFLLVPKYMKDEIFWRNYFYQVDQIKRAFFLSVQLSKPLPAGASAKSERAEVSRYPDATDNVDHDHTGPEFASDDVVHVQYSDESYRAQQSSSAQHSGSSSSSSAPVMVSHSSDHHSSAADGEDWEAEMRRELEFDMPTDSSVPPQSPPLKPADSSTAAYADEIDKELDFD